MRRTFDNKVKWCPVYNQGWVEIVKEAETNMLFCFCRECESEWDKPSEIEKDTCNCPEKYGMICGAAVDEIKEHGLEKYIIKRHHNQTLSAGLNPGIAARRQQNLSDGIWLIYPRGLFGSA